MPTSSMPATITMPRTSPEATGHFSSVRPPKRRRGTTVVRVHRGKKLTIMRAAGSDRKLFVARAT